MGAVFCAGLLGRPTMKAIAGRLGVEEDDLKNSVPRLVAKGHLRSARGGLTLTPSGRRAITVVFIGGGFEVIHRGHLYTVEKAKDLGDVLVVSVARDSTIRRRKHRDPVATEHERKRMLASLRQVDAAILGVEGDIYRTLAKVRPDVVALGYDQYHSDSEVRNQAAKRGMKVRVVRLDSPYPKVKTSSLLAEF